MDLSGKIGIWGYGKEGQSLHQHLNDIVGVKKLTILSDTPLTNIDLDTPTLSGDNATKAIVSGEFDLIFKSPGISLYKPEIMQGKSNGTVFSSATNLWFEENTKTKKIVITGTKGKSTTASLLYHVMKEMGLSVSLAGNVGIPLLSLEQETDYTVIELSSYQLADLKHTPDIFVILNLFPEHLQWHLTHKNYYNDKLRPLELSGKFKVIANAQNQELKEWISRTNKDIEWFAEKKRPYIKTQLKGYHNQSNIDAVLTVCKSLEIDESKALGYIESFAPLAHRLQEFTSSDGITCVNDSISTTPESTIAALKVYEGRSKILIIGGTDRGQDYAELIKEIKNADVKAILLLPENGTRIASELKESNFAQPIIQCQDLTQASQWIKQHASKDDIALLSPAAPSYDQFKNFEYRGDLFIKLMNK